MKNLGKELGDIALVFSGGVGLGSYQAGAYAHLQARGITPLWIAGSSVGAVNAALIAGTPLQTRLSALQSFWISDGPSVFCTPFPSRAWKHAQNWMKVVETRLFGARGHFRPRFLNQAFQPFSSVYDLTPMRERIEKLVDFDRLNGGDIRCTVATTDIETGEMVLFDTQQGAPITTQHLLASCGFLPEFPAVEIEGQLLGDGGLSGNAPIEALLDGNKELRTIFVIDLYPRDGARPTDFETALARKTDLLFGNQTYLRLEAYRRELLLREQIARLKQEPSTGTRIVLLSYHPTPEEAGSERAFDLSADSAQRRWEAGEADMERALELVAARPAKEALIAVRSNLIGPRRSP